MKIHHRACNLCEAICGLVIETENDRVISIAGDKNDPLSRGYLCPKAFALKDVYDDPNRLKTPLKRTASGWRSVSWEAALSETAERLRAVQAGFGPDAVGIYNGNPSVHNLGTMANNPLLIKTLRSKNTFSATSVDQLPHHFAAWAMFGHPLLLPIPDIARTHFMLILGGNPLASNGSLMTAPNVGEHLKNIRRRGGRVVVADPRRTETAEHADEHFFIRPASDVFLLLSLIYVVFEENRVKLGKNAVFIEGIEILRAAVSEFSPERTGAQTGIAPDDVRRLARAFSDAESAVCYGRMGLSVQRFGGLCQWLVNCLNLLSGNLDREGGVMFTAPAVDLLALAKPKNILGRWNSRVRGLPEFMGELPVAVLAEEILTPGPGQIRAMVTNCGNPVLSTPNGRQLERAFEGLDFMVSIDIYLNETTRHAHIVLPPATGLETAHYDLTFHHLAVRNTAKYSPPTLPKAPDARFDHEIMQELAHRLSGSSEPFEARPPEINLDFGLRMGTSGLSLEKLAAAPSGVDLGALQPCLPERLVHADKKIRLAPDLFLTDLERAKAHLHAEKSQESGSFTLLGRRNLRDNNSWMHNSEKLMKGKNRCTLLLHPDDATALHIEDKETVRVRSRVGTVEIEAEISDQIMPGVVSMPHGYGHNRPGIRLDVAQQHAGASINDLTDELELDALTGNAALGNVRVWVEKSVKEMSK
jgi:anaerobic selenocysteine-containing dehydrogenase